MGRHRRPGLALIALLMVGAAATWQPGWSGRSRLVDAAVTRPAAPITVEGYRWPLDGDPTVTRPFEPPPRPWMAGHRGVDLGSTVGAAVRAAGSGTVVFVGVVAGTPVISIDHPGGLRTTYQPVAPLVATGDVVRAGDQIGILLAGHPGCPVAACLHWGLRHGDEYLDPLLLLRTSRVRLLPQAGK